MSDKRPPPMFVLCDWCDSPRHTDGICWACHRRNPEYRAKFCIRGCTVIGPLLDNGERGPRQPRRADQGLLCGRCEKQLKAWLEEIPDQYATLDPRPEGGLSSQYDGKTGKVGKLSHSPALARLDVISLTDKRTMRHDDTPGEPVYIPIVITGWAALFAEENELTSPTDTIAQAVHLLTAWWSTLVKQLWIDEMWTDIEHVANLLNRAHGVERAREVGTCISIIGTTDNPQVCGTKLYALQGEQVRCPRCKRSYNGLELLRIADTRHQAERSVTG